MLPLDASLRSRSPSRTLSTRSRLPWRPCPKGTGSGSRLWKGESHPQPCSLPLVLEITLAFRVVLFSLQRGHSHSQLHGRGRRHMPGHRQRVREALCLSITAFPRQQFFEHILYTRSLKGASFMPFVTFFFFVSVCLRSFKQLIGGLGDVNNAQCDSDEVKAK